jgi:antitoxin component of MazEF toxin-antitoxin module
MKDSDVHLRKTLRMGGSVTITVPAPLLPAAKIRPGQFLAFCAVGPCILITPITDVEDHATVAAQMRAAVERAVKAWEKEKA